jgi:hypothetical protein
VVHRHFLELYFREAGLHRALNQLAADVVCVRIDYGLLSMVRRHDPIMVHRLVQTVRLKPQCGGGTCWPSAPEHDPLLR